MNPSNLLTSPENYKPYLDERSRKEEVLRSQIAERDSAEFTFQPKTNSSKILAARSKRLVNAKMLRDKQLVRDKEGQFFLACTADAGAKDGIIFSSQILACEGDSQCSIKECSGVENKELKTEREVIEENVKEEIEMDGKEVTESNKKVVIEKNKDEVIERHEDGEIESSTEEVMEIDEREEIEKNKKEIIEKDANEESEVCEQEEIETETDEMEELGNDKKEGVESGGTVEIDKKDRIRPIKIQDDIGNVIAVVSVQTQTLSINESCAVVRSNEDIVRDIKADAIICEETEFEGKNCHERLYRMGVDHHLRISQIHEVRM